MKKLLFLFVILFSVSSMTTYASFPVSENNVESEAVLTQSDVLDVQTEFNIGGFLLGFLLGLIGVGLAYIFSDDPHFRRSAWYGLGTWAIIVLIAVASGGFYY